MNRQGVLTVGEAPLPRQFGEQSPSHSMAAYECLDLWVIVSLYKGVTQFVSLYTFCLQRLNP